MLPWDLPCLNIVAHAQLGDVANKPMWDSSGDGGVVEEGERSISCIYAHARQSWAGEKELEED